MWKSLQPAADGYVTGLEPAINYPNPRAFEKASGRVAVLAAGETRAFDVALEWSPDQAATDRPSIFAAVQEQLGLKLESTRAPVDVLVIDHIERPSEN